MALKEATFRASFEDARSRAIASTYDINSPNCYNVRGAGFQLSKLVTLTGPGAEIVTNLFTITGLVKIYSVVGIFEDVTEVTDIDDVHLEVYDGTNDVDITLATDPDCSGATLNSALVKVDDSSAALAFLDADQVRIDEVTKQTILDPVMVNAKNGVTNYLRMKHDNTDENLNCQIRWYVEYRSFCGSPGSMAAV